MEIKKKQFAEASALALSVGLLVPVWGGFHSFIGISLAWPAFISAALFFSMGHQPKDVPVVLTGHLLGVGWGVAFFKIIQLLNNTSIEPLLIPLVALSILSVAAVVITHSGIRFISHLPSLFSGWAVAVGTLSGVDNNNMVIVAVDTVLSISIGIGYLGLGIPALHRFIKAVLIIPATSEDPLPRKKKNEKHLKLIGVKGSNNDKTQKYILPYRNIENEKKKKIQPNKDLIDIKNEIVKLSKYLPNYTGTRTREHVDAIVSIVGICGSPHKKGSTIKYMKKILEAAKSMGNVNTHLITVSGKDIKPCMGCKSDKCYGECKIKDDMNEIYPLLREADGIVIGSPSYFGTFSGQLKILIDRLRVMRHTNFQLANKVVAPLGVAGRRHGGQEITNLDIIQAMMRHNTIIVNDGTAVCQLGATGWSHTFDDPNVKVEDDKYGLQTCEGVGYKVVDIARAIKMSGLQQHEYSYSISIGKR